jgi:phosphocarrier protein
MIKTELEIINKLGIHARPASLLMKEAKQWNSQITITVNSKKANLNSVLEILGLGAKKGSTIELTVEGEDEQEAYYKIVNLISSGFGE